MRPPIRRPLVLLARSVGPCGACHCSTPTMEGLVKCYQKWAVGHAPLPRNGSALRSLAPQEIADGRRCYANVGPPGLVRVSAGGEGSLDAERDPAQQIAEAHDLRRESAVRGGVVVVDVRQRDARRDPAQPDERRSLARPTDQQRAL